MDAKKKVVLAGSWFEAQRERLTLSALAEIPANASIGMRAEKLVRLVETLNALREWDRWDRHQMESIAFKINYKEVDRIKVGSSVEALQVLPDGGVLSGNDDHRICFWRKGGDGQWRGEALEGHTDSIRCLQALPDGRIVSGSQDGTIRIWDGEEVVGGAA